MSLGVDPHSIGSIVYFNGNETGPGNGGNRLDTRKIEEFVASIDNKSGAE